MRDLCRTFNHFSYLLLSQFAPDSQKVAKKLPCSLALWMTGWDSLFHLRLSGRDISSSSEPPTRRVACRACPAPDPRFGSKLIAGMVAAWHHQHGATRCATCAARRGTRHTTDDVAVPGWQGLLVGACRPEFEPPQGRNFRYPPKKSPSCTRAWYLHRLWYGLWLSRLD